MGELREAILRSRRAEGIRDTVHGVLNDLLAISKDIIEYEKKGGRFQLFGMTIIGVGILLLIAGLALDYENMASIGFIMVISGGVLGFFSKRYEAKHSLWRDYQTTLVPFLRDMEEDIDPKRPVEISLDLRGPDKAKAVKKWYSKEGAYHFWQYNDPWLSLRARLRDGNIMELQCRTTWLARTKTRKSKWKWKKQMVWRASIIARNPALSWKEELDGLKLNPAKHGGRLTTIRKYKYKTLNGPSGNTPKVAELVEMFMEIYNHSRIVGGDRHE